MKEDEKGFNIPTKEERARNSVVRERAKTGFSLLSLVVCVLLVAMLIRKFTGNNTVPTFTSFLEFLTNIDTPTIPFLNVTPVSLGDWGVFNFLRDFIIIFVDLGNVILFLVNGMWIIINYVFVFFRWLFV